MEKKAKENHIYETVNFQKFTSHYGDKNASLLRKKSVKIYTVVQRFLIVGQFLAIKIFRILFQYTPF